MAAPVGGQIFSEILPYLQVNQGNVEEIEQVNQIQAPDLMGKSLKEAEKIAKEQKIELIIENLQEDTDKENIFITEQVPKPGIIINENSKIYVKFDKVT